MLAVLPCAPIFAQHTHDLSRAERSVPFRPRGKPMSMQNKPQMVEAVLFFSERGGICKQMFFPEFEALLDAETKLAAIPA